MLLDNRYQILRSLGSGGFGEALLAEDTQMPSRRRCVIKKLHPVNNDPQIYSIIRDRFQREAAILEDLGKHDQIPTLYAYFEEDGNFYLAQELIDGQSLTELMRSQGICSEAYVRDFLTSALGILEYVHAKRIIHRDINPNNIIVRERDHRPVLIDFGAVKELMSSAITLEGQVTASIVIGTPGFMSSEQAAGRPIYSSDLYALALTAIYLLTQRLPQSLEINNATGEILWSHYCPSLSPTLIAILKQAVDPNPRDRYGTATLMREALVQGSTVPATAELSPSGSMPPRSPAPGSTVLSSAPSGPNPAGPTLASSTSPSPGNDWQKTLVIAGSTVFAILVGFWMLSRSQSTTVVVDPSPTPLPSTDSTPELTPTPVPETPAPTPTPVPETPAPTPPPETPAPTPTISSAGSTTLSNEYQEQVQTQLSVARLALGLEDYEDSYDSYISAIEGGSLETLNLPLDAGNTYSIVGVCDVDCSDLDLTLYDDNGNQIDEDQESDDYPIVTVEPSWSATFRLDATMYQCDTATCVYGIGVFRKPVP
ncbi:serine/threonine-protein kinase [Prochlorothrix hollandica]|uniref:serine/threonine-protein kinase n=1 Tax=Prochlorothrix hollandica TaxID=1223 RepID=UPI001375B667|nr:serine/threonine-protein kinase [Prochlorothrix hollandica]